MNQLLSTTSLTPAPMPLNEGQSLASEAFFQFLFSEDKEMIISGPGGVGKTHLMGHLIDVILPRYYDTCKLMGILPEYNSVEMTATTNKAADALSDSTKRPTATAHSFLNLKVTDDYATGESKLTRTGGWTVHGQKILFIDECSMIDTPLLSAIREGTIQSKIVYVGDHCQLAPIMETLSPIYRQGLPFYELTEPMRTSNPHLQALNQQLRNTVETGEFRPIQIVPGVIDWLDEAAMQQELAQVFKDQNHKSRILAYTNERVVLFNEFIREIRQLPFEFTTGEVLINNTAIKMKARMLSVEEELTVLNQSAATEMVPIAHDVSLEIRKTDLRSKYGEIFKDVPLPVDRTHFDSLVKHYKRQKNWNRYFHLRNTYFDLRQRDASTVHKIQGSTLETVYIDVGNISSCNFPNQVARMLYVAASRPRSRVCFFGDLVPKYGGLIH